MWFSISISRPERSLVTTRQTCGRGGDRTPHPRSVMDGTNYKYGCHGPGLARVHLHHLLCCTCCSMASADGRAAASHTGRIWWLGYSPPYRYLTSIFISGYYIHSRLVLTCPKGFSSQDNNNKSLGAMLSEVTFLFRGLAARLALSEALLYTQAVILWSLSKPLEFCFTSEQRASAVPAKVCDRRTFLLKRLIFLQ